MNRAQRLPGPFSMALTLVLITASFAQALSVNFVNITNKKKRTAPAVTKFTYKDVVWIFFDITDFGVDKDHKCHLIENLNILDKNGDTALTYPKILKFTDTIGPGVDVVNVNNNLTLSIVKTKLPPGKYLAMITVKDETTSELASDKIAFEVTGFTEKSGQTTRQDSGSLRFGQIAFTDGPNTPEKEHAIYMAGQEIWVLTEVWEYAMDKTGKANLNEDLYLIDPGGNVALKEVPLSRFRDKGTPNEPIVFTNHISLNDPPAGSYVVKMVVTDNITGKVIEAKRKFRIRRIK